MPLVAAIALWGCGGDSPEEQATATVENFSQALAQKDYEEACGYTDRRANGRAITESVRGVPMNDATFDRIDRILEEADGTDDGGCQTLLRVAAEVDPNRAQQLADETYEDIDIAADGETATVSGSEGEWKLRESSGAWKIDDLTPLVSR